MADVKHPFSFYPSEVSQVWAIGDSLEISYIYLDGKYSMEYLEKAFDEMDADVRTWEAQQKRVN